MYHIRNLSAALCVLAMMAPGTLAIAAEGHDHGHAAESIQLQFDQGKKWQTDAVARRGMDEIRNAIMKSAPAIHKKTFTPAQYEALGAHVMTQVNDMITNCKLSEGADIQFHIVLAQIIKGVDEMKVAASSNQGTERIVQALTEYGKYFTHARWQPL
jgi:hypothetical protein